MREKLQHDKTAVARFLREAQFGARVEHPNIVRTLDYGQSDSERYYLAIEWAGGEILDKFAENSGPLSSKEVAGILSQVCSAVQAAHDVGIVHRDLKPENVMYDPAAQHVKLLDFGVAKLLTPQGPALTSIDAILDTDAVDVAAGFDFTCARLASGAVKCWGRTEFLAAEMQMDGARGG